MAGKLSIMQKMKTGKLLAESIQNALHDTTKRENKRLAKSIKDIYIIENVEIPIAIVECRLFI